ncbi:uncharacterized protein BHQ10_008277 [Talaromyces amestolkiae]|uniref:F-box domain-containing protein n=1 Tax=Talaromyces amestolkiae TaxID=1196081 RepID=A0A364L8X5_TALAM|nr:uncharacterized protein BHQ10_008277 [Talaromyces amestolkiae]RAO72265.1 hypothetical protein BHQ10_008277 [Talaromyces amestolkiae]
MSLSGILRLPTETLVSIFEFQDLQAKWKDTGSIPNIRLTCRRFCALSSHLLIRKVYVDITKPETVDRLQVIAADAGLAKGVREVYLRVHFYQSWVAASFENFVSSVESEWRQRTSPQQYYEQEQQQGSIWNFERIAWNFIRSLDQTVGDTGHHELEEQSTANNVDAPDINQIRPIIVLQRAYKLYKTGYESQDSIMRDGDFSSVLSKTLSKFEGLRRVTIYDREFHNNYGPGTTIRVPQDDHVGHETALVSVFSRPMVWEDAQWIQPTEEIRQGVPIELLFEIPMAIGGTKGIKVDFLDIQVTTAPDYTRLPTNPESLSSLTAAMDSMEIFQFGFQPRCASGCGPWTIDVDVDDDGAEVRRAGSNLKSAAELQALDKYLGAILDCKTLEHADINLGEFWIGAGFDSIRHAPTSLGINWFRESGAMRSLHLTQTPLTTTDLERIVSQAMVDDDEDDHIEFRLHEVYLCNGSWKHLLEKLRMAKMKNVQVGFAHPLGGGLDELDYEVYSSVRDQFNDRGSKVHQFIRGEIDRNPLDLIN